MMQTNLGKEDIGGENHMNIPFSPENNGQHHNCNEVFGTPMNDDL